MKLGMRKLFVTVLLLSMVFVANAQAIGGTSSNRYSSKSEVKSTSDYANIKGFVLRAGLSIGYGNLYYGKAFHNTYGIEAGYRLRKNEFGLAIDFMPLYKDPSQQLYQIDMNGAVYSIDRYNGFSIPMYAYWKFYFMKNKITPFINVGLGGCVEVNRVIYNGQSRREEYNYYNSTTYYTDRKEHQDERVLGVYAVISGGCSFWNILNVELQNIFSQHYWSSWSSYQYYRDYSYYDSNYQDNSGDGLYYAFALKVSVNFMELGKSLSSKTKGR